MRNGRLLAEAAPDLLTKHFNISSLENVFLKLCLRDGKIEADSGKVINSIKQTY